MCWPFDPGTYHHEINYNEDEKECGIEAGTLGATILRISTSRLLRLTIIQCFTDPNMAPRGMFDSNFKMELVGHLIGQKL